MRIGTLQSPQEQQRGAKQRQAAAALDQGPVGLVMGWRTNASTIWRLKADATNKKGWIP